MALSVSLQVVLGQVAPGDEPRQHAQSFVADPLLFVGQLLHRHHIQIGWSQDVWAGRGLAWSWRAPSQERMFVSKPNVRI